jgi:hypothetical protein
MSQLRPLHDVLRYCQNPPTRSTIREYYARYRVENGMPDRCDIPICIFHTQPLIWNNAPLPLILDHIDGCLAPAYRALAARKPSIGIFDSVGIVASGREKTDRDLTTAGALSIVQQKSFGPPHFTFFRLH